MRFIREETGAETSEIALVLGILIGLAAGAWRFLRQRIEKAVQDAANEIGQ